MNVINSYRTQFYSFDTDYQAVLDYADANGITKPSASVQTAQNQLMIDLKAAGIFSKLDVFHVLADNTTSNQDFKNICWKRLIQGDSQSCSSVVNGLETGQFSGATFSFDTNFNQLNDSVNYTLNDAFYGSILYSSGAFMCATSGSRNSFRMSNQQKRINSSFNNLNSSVNLSGQTGLIGISRYDSTNVSVFSKSTKYDRTQTSTSLNNATHKFGFYNGGAYAQVFSAIIIGSSFSQTDVDDFRASFNTYLDTMGLTQFA